MGVLGKHHRSFKKMQSNPYAQRGLDKFALVSAELEAKRERLVAQLGTQFSIVRFAIGSNQRDWIPVIVCPTLSKAEIRALKRTAARLIAEDRAGTNSAAGTHPIRTPGLSISESNMNDSSSYEIKNHIISVADEEDAQNCSIGTLNCLFAATERCLWMVVFTFSIAVDMISNVFLSKGHATEEPPKRILPSTRRPKEGSDNPSSNMSSCMNFSPLPPIRTRPASISAKGIKVTTPSAHIGAPKTHNRCMHQGFSTAPSTPRNSRQAQKSFQASVSFPTTTRLQDETPRSAIRKDCRFLKSVSLPKASPLQEPSSHAQRNLQSMAKQALTKKERKERAEKLGQALTGAGLVLGLGGLVMGYIPAILCIVCWWYALPSLRKAVGDKPYVKSHHL